MKTLSKSTIKVLQFNIKNKSNRGMTEMFSNLPTKKQKHWVEFVQSCE